MQGPSAFALLVRAAVHTHGNSSTIDPLGKFTTSGGTNFTLLNTHLDDQSDDQRKLGGSMIRIRARYEAVTSGEPVLVTGDFNSPPTGTDSGAYQIVTGVQDPVAVNATFAAKFAVPDDALPDFKMLDLRAQAPRALVGRNFATFTGFTAPTDTSKWTRIDFVFGGTNGGWCALPRFACCRGLNVASGPRMDTRLRRL